MCHSISQKDIFFHRLFLSKTVKRFATWHGTLQEWAVAAIEEQLIQQHVQRALAEDIGTGDVTTNALLPAEAMGSATIIARESLTVCGTAFAQEAFAQLSGKTNFRTVIEDGMVVGAGATLLKIEAPCRTLLTAERTALNYLQRLSGIATQAARYVEAVHGTGVLILDTRKTTPGYRALEKYAVVCGGGWNHRLGLYDRVLIKDNHLDAFSAQNGNELCNAVQLAREKNLGIPVEVEVDHPDQVLPVLEAGADCLLLDNFSIQQICKVVEFVDGQTCIEASGGITLETVSNYAGLGLDFISTGALVHQSRWVDIGLDWKGPVA